MRAYSRFRSKSFRMGWPLYFPVLLVVLLLSAQAVGAIEIDIFDTPQAVITAGPAPANIPPGPTISVTTSATTAGTDIIGGDRLTAVDLTTATQSEGVDAKVQAGDFSNNFDTTAYGHVHLEYNGSLTPGTFGLGANLCAGTQFVVTFATNDHAVNYTMQVFTDATNSSSFTVTVPPGIISDTDVVYPFASFVQDLGAAGPADFCNVGAIHFHWDTDVDNQPALDMSIRQIEVPDELGFGCDYKTFDGQALLNLPKTTVLPHNILAEVSITNTGAVPIPIGALTITDTLDVGLSYTGPTLQTSGPAGMIVDPPDSQVGQVVIWTNKVAFPAGATAVFEYPVTITALPPGQTLQNDVVVEMLGLPDSNCFASVRMPSESTVPAMNQWGMIFAVLGVTLFGIYLYRRRTA